MGHGCLNAFPFVAQHLLRAAGRPNFQRLEIDLVAYPGTTLVTPTEAEVSEGMSEGMMRRFFHISFSCILTSRRTL
jgi:hypothetical protein